MKYLYIITGALMCILSPVPTGSFPFQRSVLNPLPESSSDNVQCFLDFMELWVLRRQINGLLLWLSQVMRFPVSLSSLDRTNHLISRCRYTLDTDSNGNFIFRAHYTACNVQIQNGLHILEIHMVKKTSSGNGRSDRYLMRCPAMTESLGRERVRCDPNYVQVSRPMPLETSDDQEWFLLFRGELVVSVDDASLIGVEAEISKFGVTVKGLRGQLLDTKQFMDRQTDVLPLWMTRGFYAYSLEASCPLDNWHWLIWSAESIGPSGFHQRTPQGDLDGAPEGPYVAAPQACSRKLPTINSQVSQHPGDEVTLHIPKQRMGLVKRGSYVTETLTLRNIVARQSINVTVTENKNFVLIATPANEVLQRQDCNMVNNARGVQVFYSIDLVLEFAEIAYQMNWTLENYYECTALSSDVTQTKTPPEASEKVGLSAQMTANDTMTKQEITALANTTNRRYKDGSPTLIPGSLYTQGTQDGKYLVTSAPDMKNRFRSGTLQLVVSTETSMEHSGEEQIDISISGSGDSEILPQEEERQISNNERLNPSMYNENKHRRILSNRSAKLSGLSSPVETAGKNVTFDINVIDEERRPTTISPPVTERRGSDKVSLRPVTYPLVAEPDDTRKPVNQLHLNSKPTSEVRMKPSSQRQMDDAISWEMLKGDTLSELLDETTREGLISPDYRKEIEFTDKTGSEKVLSDDEEKTTDETAIPKVNGQSRQTGDLRYLSGTKGDQHTAPLDKESLLPSSYSIDGSISNGLPEETLNNTAMELETIGSAEQLLVST